MEDVADMNQSIQIIKDDHIKPTKAEETKAANSSTNASGNTSRSQSAEEKKPGGDGNKSDQDNQKSPGASRKEAYTFDEHMWDKLPEIEKHSNQGSKLLQEFASFCKNYNSSLQKFGNEVSKHFETFNKNL